MIHSLSTVLPTLKSALACLYQSFNTCRRFEQNQSVFVIVSILNVGGVCVLKVILNFFLSFLDFPHHLDFRVRMLFPDYVGAIVYEVFESSFSPEKSLLNVLVPVFFLLNLHMIFHILV